MKYAVEVFFDNNIESYVKGIWKSLDFNGITSNMEMIEEIRGSVI